MAGAREAGKEIEEASLIGFKNTISSRENHVGAAFVIIALICRVKKV